MAKEFKIGDVIRLTGKHLRSTGQGRGAAGLSRWTVQAVRGNGWLVTDERLSAGLVETLFTHEDLEADPLLWFRQIAPGNAELA